MEENKIKDEVVQILSDYLVKKHLRKTPERLAILEQVYSLEDHFDIESLYELMLKKGLRVSRATVYNTIDLFLECRLVIKHQFGSNISYYEKAYDSENHHHLICTECGDIQELKDVEIKNVIQGKKFSKFKLSHYNLYLYGICNKCKQMLRRKAIHT